MSAFNILAVRDGDAVDDPLYPMPGEQPDCVEPDDHDGQSLPPFVVSELAVCEFQPGISLTRLIHIQKIKAVVRASQSRLTVACSKYDKGGSWTPWTAGAIPVALTANAVSKVRASRRRRGKMLVGHVRYPWLFSVAFKSSGLPVGHDVLRLVIIDPTQNSGRYVTLDFWLARQQSGSDVAQRITQLAAGYRLDYEANQLDSAGHELLTKLKTPPALQPVPKQFVSYFFADTTKPSVVTDTAQNV